MSRWRSSLLSRLAGRREAAGFTLVEVMVAMVVLALGAAAVVPVLVLGSRTANLAKLHTQAKNLAQERLERMRDLQFHVERQNGPFVDLIDQYYTNLVTTATTRSIGGESTTGQWVSSGTVKPGEPALPFYRVTFPSITGYPQFSQVVDSQFLVLNGTAAPASLFPSYDSQVEAYDGPPTLLLGVTVLTTWTVNGKQRTYSSYTRIADSRGTATLLTSRGSAELLRVTSATPGGAALAVDVASAVADGSLSTGSAASGSTRAGLAQDSINPDTLAANGLSLAPSGVTSGTASRGQVVAGSGTCGWASFGRSDVQGLPASLSTGVPQVPSDVGTGGLISAGLNANGGNSCQLFSFNNQSTTTDPLLQLNASAPLVRIPDPTGNSRVAFGSSWVNASTIAAIPHTVTSGGAASSAAPVQIFPGLPFVTDGRGLVNVTLNSSSLSCAATVSAGTQVQSSAASYSITVDYWKSSDATGGGSRVSTTYTWNSASPSADPLASVPPSSINVYQNGTTVLKLSDYIGSWGLLRAVGEGATNGVHSLNGIFTAATTPVRGAADPASSVGIQLGLLSCVADDAR